MAGGWCGPVCHSCALASHTPGAVRARFLGSQVTLPSTLLRATVSNCLSDGLAQKKARQLLSEWETRAACWDGGGFRDKAPPPASDSGLHLYSLHTWGPGAPHWTSEQVPEEQDLLGCKERGQCVRVGGVLFPPEGPCLFLHERRALMKLTAFLQCVLKLRE